MEGSRCPRAGGW